MTRSSSRTSASAAAARNRVIKCPRCLLQQRVCLCAEVPTIATRTRVVIVRHHLEQFRSSNSGRLAHLALTNSEIVDHGGDRRAGAAARARRCVAAVPRRRADDASRPVPPPRQLIVLDATWSQARRMYRKLDALRGLPILRLPDEPMPRGAAARVAGRGPRVDDRGDRARAAAARRRRSRQRRSSDCSQSLSSARSRPGGRVRMSKLGGR